MLVQSTRPWRVKKMTIAALVLLVALLSGGWLWTPDKTAAELQARYAQDGSSFVTEKPCAGA